jgi:hypothetical protein
MSFAPDKDPKLGSLTQAARGKHLQSARTILFVIGVLTILVNGLQLMLVEEQVRKLNLPRADHDHVIALSMLILGSAVALGVVFIIFGFLIKQYPVPISVLSLVLYIGAIAVYGMIEPTTLIQGIIFKIIFIVALAKAVKAALAYQKEKDEAAALGYGA